jgi:dTMP kinase
LVKPLLKARKAAHSLSPQEFSLLHAADFRYRLETEVLPALWEGKTVVADRYLFTALARDAARGLDLRWLLEVYRPLFWPDIVFYFSVSPETSGKRIAADRAPNYYESGQDVTDIADPWQSYAQFMARVIQEYEALAKVFHFVTVDAEQSIFEQHRLIRSRYGDGIRRPWEEWNQEVLTEWLAHQPKVAKK